MTDYDKAVKGLEAHVREHASCLYCPYTSIKGATCMNQMHKDALALIREQQEEIQRLCDALKPEPPKEEDSE